MSFSDLFDSGEHLRNLGHFASIVNLAAVNGELNEKEKKLVDRFAQKLDIAEDEYKKIIKNPSAYPIGSYNSIERRLDRLHDLFKIIFADNNEIDREEEALIKRYAIGLGFSAQASEKIIKRSIQIFSGQLSFEDYRYLLEKET